MKEIFSETNNRTTWRRLWTALAEAQMEYGLVKKDELEDLKSKAGKKNIDISKAHKIEKEIRHDLMSEIKVFAEQTKVGGKKIHLGATSADIEDNADILKMNDALELVLTKLVSCLRELSRLIEEYKAQPCIGWTHLQPAEPTTLGYRLANYAQDIVLDINTLENLSGMIKGKGFKGAVGTYASYQRTLEGKATAKELEDKITEIMGLKVFPVTTQTYPRKVDYLVLSLLASIAQSTSKFGLDLRIMQSPSFGELSEPIGKNQVGSSAMPFKRNPISSERICSLARYLGSLVSVAHGNASNSILERTLDDSANRRIIIPEAFLAIDECLMNYMKIISGLIVYPKIMEKNFYKYGAFSTTEALMMKLVERGGDRQEIHEHLRKISFKAWEEVSEGKENPIIKDLKSDKLVKENLNAKEIDNTLDPKNHMGESVEACERFLEDVTKPILKKYQKRTDDKKGPVF